MSKSKEAKNSKAGAGKSAPGKTIALNKSARHEYHLEDRYEAGLSLQGWELKAIRAAGFAIANVDSTIIAQAPRMAPYIDAMAENIAADLGIAKSAVNVKAKTTERLGFTGRGEGIAAEAVALLTVSIPERSPAAP